MRLRQKCWLLQWRWRQNFFLPNDIQGNKCNCHPEIWSVNMTTCFSFRRCFGWRAVVTWRCRPRSSCCSSSSPACRSELPYRSSETTPSNSSYNCFLYSQSLFAFSLPSIIHWEKVWGRPSKVLCCCSEARANGWNDCPIMVFIVRRESRWDDNSNLAGDNVLDLCDNCAMCTIVTREKICFLIYSTQNCQLFTWKLDVESWGPTLRNRLSSKKLRREELCFLINFSTIRTVKLKNKVGAQLSHPIFNP